MARRDVLSEDDKRSIVWRALQGETYVRIAEDYGITASAVAYHAGPVVGSRRQSKLTDDQIASAVERWRNGETVAEMAREYGVGHSALSNHIVRATGEPIGRVRRASGLSLPSDPSELAYLAGIIDGEGCISFSRSSRAWTVAITNTSGELEAWLKPLGGYFYYPPRIQSIKQDGSLLKQRFEWKVCRAWDVLRLLREIRPFLKIKVAKADRAISEIVERFGDPPDTGGRSSG